MTEEEFLAWCDEDVKAEFVDGEVIIMSPATSTHEAVFKLVVELVDLYARRKQLGEVYGSQLQIRLPSGRRRVPDLLFVRRERAHLVGQTEVNGAPDAVFEIVAEDSVERDYFEKFAEYAAAHIPEYWIIDPEAHRVHLYRLRSGVYRRMRPQKGALRSHTITEFYLRPQWLWQTPLPDTIELLRELGAL